MAPCLTVSIGAYSSSGRKGINQDFHGALIPTGALLTSKGVAVAIADGISSSDVSHIASQSAVKAFLTDYYCTPESWPVKTSVQRVIAATNSWLHAQTRRGRHPYDRDKGYVCTIAVMVLKSRIAHIFHAGDSLVHRLNGQSLEQLTTGHRLVISSAESYLSRALGMDTQIELDYLTVPARAGDIFMLTTDGVHEYVTARFAAQTIAASMDLDAAAAAIGAEALARGSPDNLTVQIVRIDQLPEGEAEDISGLAAELPPPPLPEPHARFDGYLIQRELHGSSRSHIYLATDLDDGSPAVLKLPSIDQRGDPAYLQRFLMEEWIARRIDSAHVLRPRAPSRNRTYLYTVMEFVEGITLAQWMIDNPRPDLETVRGLVEQIARGLRAFHRKEMLHLDLRPENIMIDKTGTVKIIDFGSTHLAGAMEGARPAPILGTLQYTAPEIVLGFPPSPGSDLFGLGVLTYQMLTGRLPHGAAAVRAREKAQFRKLRYVPVDPPVPAWINHVLAKAVAIDPSERYGELSEFTYDLRHPGAATGPPPLIARNPLVFWQTVTGVLVCVVLYLLGRLNGTWH